MTNYNAQASGHRAETRVLTALTLLPAPWQHFHTVEWRTLTRHGESIGEADVIVFHPQHGLIVFEIKAGAVEVREGRWFYASGLEMKQSPFSQARRNRYALIEKLHKRLGRDTVDGLSITHAAWFPEVNWSGPLPGCEIPSRSFLLDRSDLADPVPALTKLLREAFPDPKPWTRPQQQVLRDLLAPDCHLLVPLGSRVDDTVSALQRATDEQIRALRLLRSQSRLLVEGGAGSGKTMLAVTLAREHAANGKSVLLTCFNRALALHLSAQLDGVPGLTVCNFHELVKLLAEQSGLGFKVPADDAARRQFFNEDCAELLLNAAERLDLRFDTLIVDEAADFSPTWWVALETLGAPGFAWYCFFDRRQSVFRQQAQWSPPFVAEPLVLEANLRNARPIGERAALLGQCVVPTEFRVEHGPAPQTQLSGDFTEMAGQLRQVLRTLLKRDGLRPEQVVVLAPYRHTNATSGWAAGLDEVTLNLDVVNAVPGQVRIGTIQGFKGLEADVVIVAGLDRKAGQHPEWLYVGASRARAALFLLALDSAGLS